LGGALKGGFKIFAAKTPFLGFGKEIGFPAWGSNVGGKHGEGFLNLRGEGVFSQRKFATLGGTAF